MHPENPPGAWYVVSPGETLEQIAARAGVPPEDILEINGLSRASDVRPGKIIYVLAGRGPASAAPGGAPAAAAAVAAAASLAPPRRRPRICRRRRSPASRSRRARALPVAARRAAAVGSPFGTRAGRQHEGIDLPAPIGTPVYAAADGQVVYAGNGIRGYGNLIVHSTRGRSPDRLRPQLRAAGRAGRQGEGGAAHRARRPERPRQRPPSSLRGAFGADSRGSRVISSVRFPSSSGGPP